MITSFLYIVVMLITYYVMFSVAEKNNRSFLLWAIISFIISPFLVIIILLVLGKSNEKHN